MDGRRGDTPYGALAVTGPTPQSGGSAPLGRVVVWRYLPETPHREEPRPRRPRRGRAREWVRHPWWARRTTRWPFIAAAGWSRWGRPIGGRGDRHRGRASRPGWWAL